MQILIDGMNLEELRRVEEPKEPKDAVQNFIAACFEASEEEQLLPMLSEKAVWFRASDIYPESCEKEFYDNIRRQSEVSCCRRIAFVGENKLVSGSMTDNGALSSEGAPVAMVQGEYFCQNDEISFSEITHFNFVCVLESEEWKINFYSSRNAEASGEENRQIIEKVRQLSLTELCLQIPLVAFTFRPETEGFELINMNEMALSLIGYPDCETLKRICGTSILNLLHPDDLGGYVAMLRADREQLRHTTPLAVRIRHADYSYHWMLVKLEREIGEDGKEACLCMCMSQSFSYYGGHTGQSLDRRDISDLMVESRASEPGRIWVRTFGYFELFVDGKAVAFRHKKAKELLALLVDLRGGFLSPADAVSILWEDDPMDQNTLARYRKTAMHLRETLQEAGIEDILYEARGMRRIVPEKLECDSYNYVKNPRDRRQMFTGTYMMNYSWAENTAAMLSRIAEEDKQHS